MDRRDFLAAAAAPFLLGAAPALARPSGGMPLALVTADLESSIVAVSLATGRVHRRLPTEAAPRSIESVSETAALVAHTDAGAMTLVDGRTLQISAIAGTFGEPRYTAVRADGRLAYVTDSGRREIAVVDVRGRRVVARTAVGGPARHLSLDRSGTRLWVALGTKAARVAILDLAVPARPRLVGTITPPFLAHDIGFTPGGRRVWVTSGDRGRIAIYEARAATLVRTLDADAPPQHVTFLGDRAFVTSGDDAMLRVHAVDGRLLRSAPVPDGSYNVQQGWGVILTPSLSQGTLCTFSARGAPMVRTRVARSSHDSCFVMSP
jgi:DNA-binding beta-propeller fold protein YncE